MYTDFYNVTGVPAASDAPIGSCPTDTPSLQDWFTNDPQKPQGFFTCFTQAGADWIMWTNDSELVLVYSSDGTVADLYATWHNVDTGV